MAHIVKCRICHKPFDTEKEEAVILNKQSYYHKTCYEEWIGGRMNVDKEADALFWKESVIDFLYREIKMEVDFVKFERQWTNFTKPERKMTPKGIYFAVRYHFNVQHGSIEKSLGGIGIVPYVYKSSSEYWQELEYKKRGTIEAIVQQIRERGLRPTQKIVRKEEKKDKNKWDLGDI